MSIHIEDQQSLRIDKARVALYEASFNKTLSPRQKIKTIEHLGIIFGFDLIQIIFLITNNNFSGYLNIISSNNIYGITFLEGNIIQIDNKDEATLIGQILINDGYLNESELSQFLKSKNSLIGQELVSSGKICQMITMN